MTSFRTASATLLLWLAPLITQVSVVHPQGVTTPSPQTGLTASLTAGLTEGITEAVQRTEAAVAQSPKERMLDEMKAVKRLVAITPSHALGNYLDVVNTWARLLEEMVERDALKESDLKVLRRIPLHGQEVPKRKQIIDVFVGMYPQDLQRDAELVAKIDSASAYSLVLASRRRIWQRKLFPVTSREDAVAYWRQESVSTLNWGGISGGLSSGAVYSELVSPLLHAVRVSVYGVIAAAEDDGVSEEGASQATLERFVNGGGLVNVAFTWPFLHVGEPSGGTFDFAAFLAPRVGASIPILGGAAAPDTSSVYDIGAELHGRTIDFFDGVGVFGQIRAGVAGGSTNFFEAMGLGDRRQAFTYSTGGLGLLLGNKVAVLVTTTIGGPKSVRDFGTRLSVTAFKGGDLKVPRIVVP
jgi:hypothetical protein